MQYMIIHEIQPIFEFTEKSMDSVLRGKKMDPVSSAG